MREPVGFVTGNSGVFIHAGAVMVADDKGLSIRVMPNRLNILRLRERY